MNAAAISPATPPAPECIRELLGGGPAVRVPPGPVAYHHERYGLPVEVLLAQQLGDPARHQRRHPRVSADRGRPAEPHLGESPVPRQRVGHDHLTIVTRAGEERHDRDLVGGQLVEHGVEPRLPLVERRGHLVEQPAGPERFRQPADERVGGGIAARAMGHQHQRPAAHRATSSGSRSIVGSSRPVTTVRVARRPMSRW
jgi:hypothetical protein